MAVIRIVHVSNDRDAASDLGDELQARGYDIQFDADLDTALSWKLDVLSHCDCVIVFWTAVSISSEGLSAVAREALHLGLLLPVRSASLSVEYIPLDFRNLNTPVVGDMDGILRALSHLNPGLFAAQQGEDDRIGSSEATTPDVGAAQSIKESKFGRSGFGSGRSRFELPRVETPMGVGAASGPPMGPRGGTGAAPQASPQDDALAVEAGRLVHKIPNKMWLGEQEVVEVRLGRTATAALTEGLVGRGALTTEDLPVVESMSVSVYAKGGSFDIERQSETTQLIMSDHLKGSALETADFGRWIWLVTPRKTGAHQMFVRVSASLKDSRGLPTSTTLPDKEFQVSVSVHAGRAVIKALRRGILGIAGVVGAALLGAITQDLWWPALKALLASWWGWLG